MGCNESKNQELIKPQKINKNKVRLQIKFFQNYTLFSQSNYTNTNNNTNYLNIQYNNYQQQNLNLSDYQAFINKSEQQGRTDYPSIFQLLSITSLSDQQLTTLPKQDVASLNCTRKQLINISVQIIMNNSFASNNFEEENIRLLVTAIAQRYHSIPYHNFSHGFSLMQMLYKCFILDSNLSQLYSDEQLTYYLIASITHDINHRGTNNQYQIKIKSLLARQAQNISVLEKMHINIFFLIIKQNQKFNVIAKSNNQQKIKQNIVRVILATDMSRHFENLQKLQKISYKLQQYNNNNSYNNLLDEQQKIIIMQNIIHACDIGNSLLKYDEYIQWGILLTYQFNQQTKLEQLHKVQITEYLKYKGRRYFYEDQIGFIRKFVVPVWKQIGKSFGGVLRMVGNAEENVRKIQDFKKQLKQH